MPSRFQAASLVASPSYPNAVAWSDENLVAIASGHLVTILNPDMPFGPRGLITIPVSKAFPIGVIERDDLLSGSMLPISLSRDRRPCVRSVSWSPVGLAPNSGCLLAVCTTDGRVKLYRFPFCEFSAEWVEVTDISEMLYTYLANINFWELDVRSSEFSNGQASQQVKDHEFLQSVGKTPSDNPKGERSIIISVPKSVDKRRKKKEPEETNLPLISADQYSSRNSMLSSLVVAWSPILETTSLFEQVCSDNSSDSCSILAVGAKSGRISFWKIRKPQRYSIMHGLDPTDAVLVGFVHAHRSWVTAISWALTVHDSSSQLLLATGSSDGSVKIWQGCSAELLNISEIFSLFHEVIGVDSAPVSVLSPIVPLHSPKTLSLAVGKASGTLEVWTCEISTREFYKVGSYHAHGQIVTGLSWAFDGNCLYSSSQDDSVRCWILNGDSLCEVPLPSSSPGVRSSTEVPSVFDSCFGVAVSPGNLVVAVARSFDSELLNPMYQARSQKAAVEFFWIGGQQRENLSNEYPDFDVESFPGFTDNDLLNWEHNILWSLNQQDHLDNPLVIWDIISALLAFKQFAPTYVYRILEKWLRSYVGSHSYSTQILSDVCEFVSNISSRKLHLLDIIVRRVVLTELKADKVNCETQSLEGTCGPEEEQTGLWMKLLKSSEKELRERLVGLSFSAVIDLVSRSSEKICKPGYWCPVGLAHQEQWVESERDHVRDYLKLLVSEVGNIEKSKLCLVSEYIAEEQCSYCSAHVPFESSETAFCQGDNDAGGQRHQLARCSVSMLVNPTTPSWLCVCCHRWASKLAPREIFIMSRYPEDVNSISTLEAIATPLCPFCGILLQRSQPEFLLSPAPV